MNPLTHFDEHGTSRMVDTTAKPETERMARASGRVHMAQATAQLMKRFYFALRSGQSVSSSLAAAQRSTLADAGLRAPFYWAGFVLDGSL